MTINEESLKTLDLNELEDGIHTLIDLSDGLCQVSRKVESLEALVVINAMHVLLFSEVSKLLDEHRRRLAAAQELVQP